MKTGVPEPIASLNRIKILENGEPLVDVRKYCPEVIVLAKAVPYLRTTVADMLNQAQQKLNMGFRLEVHSCLRTIEMQKKGWDTYCGKMRDAHPEWPTSALRRAVNRYYAPYDQAAPPGHCTGGAVDVKLLGPDGSEIDLICPTKDWEAAYTWSDKIDPDAKFHRMMMVTAMLDAGFSNCRDEYWHYSWGDSAWAVRTGRKECCYGKIDPPAGWVAPS